MDASIVSEEKAAGEPVAAKHTPHRPSIARALGLRAREAIFSL